MNNIRSQIKLALEGLIEEKNGFVFQRLACACLRSRWPSLMATAEQADLAEDAMTVVGEGSEGVIRSLACSLTGTWDKVSSDAHRIASQRSDVQELIFATPKTVIRKTQANWEKRIKEKYGWKLIVVERSEFLAILERPGSQWLCKQYLKITLGYQHLLEAARSLRDSGEIEVALKKAQDAERGALDVGDWETLCRVQVLLAELHLDKDGLCENYRNKALEALSTAREHQLTSLLAECLALRANSIMGKDPKESRRLLEQAESVVGDDLKISRWICLIQAELEHMQGDLDGVEEALRKWEALVGNNRGIDHQSFHHMKFRLEAKRGNDSEALDYLNKSLKRARSKKRWMSAGAMLHEKARYLARKGGVRRAAREAEKARETFEKARNQEAALDSALLSGHLFFECHDAERALGLADYILSQADPKQYGNMHQDALQLKTKSLQVLNRIEEAKECNRRFRESTAHIPQSLVVADIQEAMLFAQSGDYEQAEAIMKKGFERAKATHVQEEIIAAIKVHWAQIKMDQAKHREARSLAEDALRFEDKLPPKVRDEATHIAKVAEGRAPLTSLFEDLLNNPTPLKLAGTDKSKNIQEAHQELVRPLSDWTDKWPKALQEIYDFWGRGNLARYILNHRGFPNAFHVTVEAITVEETRQWAQVLCPLVDVLTILWKGPVLSRGMALVPVHHKYEGAGGWGYAIAAGSDMRPDENSDDWNWSPAIGWATLLPKDAVKFLFDEARALFEAGRLFLLPALHVGCIDPGHGPLERMFNDVTNASPILSSQGSNSQAIRLDSLPLPYFPDVPLDELARMVIGEEDSLLKTRLALREWARNLGSRDNFETRGLMQECYERVESALSDVDRKFNELARKLKWAKQGESIHPHVFDIGKFKIEPTSPAAEELTALHGELRASPWYAYFRLSSQGYRWDLMRMGSKSSMKSSKVVPPDRVHHWLVPPQAGWTIPTIVARMPMDDAASLPLGPNAPEVE